MDTVSISRERDDAEITDSSTTEGPSQEAPQSEVPEVSLCPPDSDSTESQMCSVKIEENQADSSSPLKSHSSTQLHRQVSHGSGYHSPQRKRCPCCGQQQSNQSNVCPGQMNAYHQADCLASPVKTVHSCSPSRLPSCHNKTQCHWLHESHDGSNHKHHMVTVRNAGLHRIPRSYSQVIVEYPMTVLILCTVVLFGCSLAGILTGPLPDFSDPLLGFEPRGTDISIRLATWMRLQQNTGPGKSLSPFPWQLTERIAGEDTVESEPQSRERSRRMLRRDNTEHNFFCNAPGEHYAQLIFRSGNSSTIFASQMYLSKIRSGTEFDKICQVRSELYSSMVKNECCPSWSLGNYLAVLNNISSCFSLTAQQVSESLSLLRFCAPYYHDGSLAASCTERSKFGRCASIPHRCKLSSIFQILHYLVDKDFLGPQTVEYKVPSLKYSMVFLPVKKGDPLMKIYLDHLEGHELTYNNTTITGMDLGIKQKLFKYYLARDSVYPVLAALALLFTMGLYLKSLFIAAMSLVAVILSLSTSYFFYKVAFRLTFFPLLNLASVLVLLGSCLNQALTFVDFWKLQLSQNPPAVPKKRMNRVLQEMGYLILVSGLTSSITFYSGYISSITAVRCYAVYLGSASLINTLFALIWLPCTLILQERYAVQASNPVAKAAWKPCCSKNTGGFWETSSRKRCLFTLRQKLRMLGRGFSDTSNLLFLKILPCGVVKFRYIWICWFAVLAAGGTYISCVDPGMKLPTSDSRTTQLFRSSHPFERYDAEYRHQFMFERMKQGEDEPMLMTLIWGIIPSDDGDHFDPKSNGSLALDPGFNMSSLQAQLWLRDLCGKIQNQSFYSPLSADQETVEDNVCFVEQLIHWVSIRRCSESEDAFSFCCNNIPFPFPPSVFEQCLSMMVAEQHAEGHSPSAGGLRFDSEGRITALVVIFKTEQLYSFNFSRMSQFYQEVLSWFNGEISKAPVGLQKGWFVSQLGLYDLQQCLSSETLEVAGFSVALTFVLLLLMTWNIPLSLYVSVAVGGSVFATVGLLVLLEWQVAHSLKRMGCPVATGAGAYFCVGIIMLPATALLFRKLGIFLLLVKCVACGFATFFFQSLCCFFGPQKNCGRITLPCVTKQATENILSSCSATEPGTTNPAANGAFGCGTGSQVRRSFNKESEGFLGPNQQHHRKRQPVGGREPEQCQSSGGLQLWNMSLSSSSSMEEIRITQTTDTVNERSLSIDEGTSCHLHKRLLSCQSQSSMEGLEDSNETFLSEVEPAILVPQAVKIEEELQPGHLNGKRDTLRLSLKETVYDLASPGSSRVRTTQSEVPVILPNSKPDMPDVWIKREGKGEGGS
uniref:Dispatched homolog 2 (Drosophila) n=1 Tax=Cyprinus carpio TaxID=7962 RepID=A0A8C2HF33_CYPCA